MTKCLSSGTCQLFIIEATLNVQQMHPFLHFNYIFYINFINFVYFVYQHLICSKYTKGKKLNLERKDWKGYLVYLPRFVLYFQLNIAHGDYVEESYASFIVISFT